MQISQYHASKPPKIIIQKDSIVHEKTHKNNESWMLAWGFTSCHLLAVTKSLKELGKLLHK